MNRQQAIDIIEGLYPVDSPYLTTAAVGERLLTQAKRDCESWKGLPECILFRYAELCQQEEEHTENALLRRTRNDSRWYPGNQRRGAPGPPHGKGEGGPKCLRKLLKNG